MDEREPNDLLWRSWYLGVRLGLRASNTPETAEQLKECLRSLDDIARNKTTLHTPPYKEADLDPQTKQLIIGLWNQGVRADRELAALILEGSGRAATFADGTADLRPSDPLALSLPAAGLPRPADRLPLRWEEGGVYRVGKSRISLDLVVEQYENGMTPEELVRAYDTLVLADVYAVITYYLRHRDEVRTYLKRRGEEAEALRAKIEAERPRVPREELLARRRATEKDHAPTGQ
jgi:uncharacterized protein (DUF433 family)